MSWETFGKIVLLMFIAWIFLATLPASVFGAYFRAKLADERQRMTDR